MKEKSDREKKVFCSAIEFEKEYFPATYEQRLATKQSEKVSAQGTGLAVELLENLRRKLKK